MECANWIAVIWSGPNGMCDVFGCELIDCNLLGCELVGCGLVGKESM